MAGSGLSLPNPGIARDIPELVRDIHDPARSGMTWLGVSCIYLDRIKNISGTVLGDDIPGIVNYGQGISCIYPARMRIYLELELYRTNKDIPWII